MLDIYARRLLVVSLSIGAVAAPAFGASVRSERVTILESAFPVLRNPEKPDSKRAFVDPALRRAVASPEIEARFANAHANTLMAREELATAARFDEAWAATANSRLAAAEAAEAAIVLERKAWIAEQSTIDPAKAGMLAEWDTIVISFRDSSTLEEICQTLDKFNGRYGLTVRSGVASADLFFAELPNDEVSDDAEAARLRTVIQELEKEPAVLGAFYNTLLGGNSVPQESSEKLWNYFDGSDGTASAIFLHLPEAWNLREGISRRGQSDVKILVLDEGFAKHDDLPLDQKCTTFPSLHGNQMLGIIAALFNNGKGTDGGTPFSKPIACAPNLAPFVSVGATDVQIKDKVVWFTTVTKQFDQIVRSESPRIANVSLGYNWMRDLIFARTAMPLLRR
jgi:hypothetical protein